MNASSADFAATAPWSGIIGKPAVFPSAPSSIAPDGASANAFLVFSASQSRYVPLTPQQAAAIILQFLHLTPDSVGLGEVDNTSDDTKNQAIATLLNKTILGASILDTIAFGLRAPTGFDLLLATDSLLTSARTLLLRVDDADRSLELTGGNLIVSLSDGTGTDETRIVSLDGDITIRVNQALRTLDLSGDLTLRGGDLIVELSDGTGSGEDRTIHLTDDLSILGAFALILRLTAASDLTLPTTGTLSTLAGAETLTNKNIITPTGIVKGDVGLGSVDNTADADKPVSTAQAASIATKQPLTGNSFAVAGLPAAASNVGRVVYCTNGSAGAPCAAISDGTDWKVIALGATVSP